MDQIKLLAHAKVNLTLDVVGRRNDGYHLLESVMQSISLADQITLSKRQGGISLQVKGAKNLSADETNTAWRAAAAFFARRGIEPGVCIELEKKIPIAAGLGGGSSNAAAVLTGLNSLYGGGLSLGELQKIGLTIGADVPFCLQGGTAAAAGIGEKLTPIKPLPPVTFALVNIPKEVSTAGVFQKFPPAAFGSEHTRNFIKLQNDAKSVSQLSRSLQNSLEIVTTTLVPEIEVWKRRLISGGAEAAFMSGSGPTVLGLFSERETAARFRSKWEGRVKVILAEPETTGVKYKNGVNLP
ncbi:MAG TPA: 4-(cytidine 5'-diphospho)-2-C-methyl-D-erythritol kinase [Firmicutes bacterium]|nr:4-(cytidine 5'-diphospho)-2-C-methyl-D-erythritol kinase [Bacillota bacterium]